MGWTEFSVPQLLAVLSTVEIMLCKYLIAGGHLHTDELAVLVSHSHPLSSTPYESLYSLPSLTHHFRWRF